MKKIPKVASALFLALSLLPVSDAAAAGANSFAAAEASPQSGGDIMQGVYELELSRWKIYNDGTHPAETTDGINKALSWAGENGYTTFKVPAGTYLIAKPDPKAPSVNTQINMVSNMTFLMDDKAVLQKETNNSPGYTLFNIGPGVKNATLRGGTYKGDKDTHSYSGGGTHEGGYGIITSGAENVTIDGIKAINFTGDGLSIGSMGTLVDEFYAGEFKSGSVDASGKLVADAGKVRLENLPIKHPYFDVQRTFQLLNPRNLPKEANGYTAYFYKADGSFISSVDTKAVNKPIGWGLVDIPSGAASMNIVFDIPKVDANLYLEYWMQGVSKNVVVTNSEFAFNRRQGITVGGGQNIVIDHNEIHDMKGTAPQSGIDVEAGFNLNDGITVKNNNFYNNQAYDLILYDGRNATVDGNHFGSKSIGLAISEPFKYATVTNNQFDGARIYAYNEATFKNNKMNDALAAFLGSHLIIDGMEFTDSLVNLASSTPFGIQASNITVNNTKKKDTPLGVNANPIHLSNVTINGQAAVDSFAGNAKDGSVFDNLKVTGYTRTQLPRGTYNNCVFESASQEGAAVNNTGTYEFNQCSFKSQKGGFEVNSVHGVADSVYLRNSTIEVTGDNSSGVSIQAGKKVVIENNTISAGNFPYATLAALQVSNYWDKSKPNDIMDLTIRGNTVKTKGKASGISTIYAGVGAPAYRIENNTLFNAKLNLKANDVNSGNAEK